MTKSGGLPRHAICSLTSITHDHATHQGSLKSIRQELVRASPSKEAKTPVSLTCIQELARLLWAHLHPAAGTDIHSESLHCAAESSACVAQAPNAYVEARQLPA